MRHSLCRASRRVATLALAACGWGACTGTRVDILLRSPSGEEHPRAFDLEDGQDVKGAVERFCGNHAAPIGLRPGVCFEDVYMPILRLVADGAAGADQAAAAAAALAHAPPPPASLTATDPAVETLVHPRYFSFSPVIGLDKTWGGDVFEGIVFEGIHYIQPGHWSNVLPVHEYQSRPIRYLEIGTYFGANLIYVAGSYGLHSQSELHCIDLGRLRRLPRIQGHAGFHLRLISSQPRGVRSREARGCSPGLLPRDYPGLREQLFRPHLH